MNPKLEDLYPYPFEKLRHLKEGLRPPEDKPHIAFSIGEPKHAAPERVVKTLKDALTTLNQYPLTRGSDELRRAISQWATKRFNLSANGLDHDRHVLPLSGTREGLFSFVQATFNPNSKKRKIIMPNPFYQIYEGAALLAGAETAFVNCHSGSSYQPDFNAVDEQDWQDCQLLFICSPGNPTGKVLSSEELIKLIALAKKYDFVLASDECYSELYFNEAEPPTGLLEACMECGNDDFSNCVVFHSLSKRSNLPGLRSGFIAGDASIIAKFLKYRTYHGCAMPSHSQLASIAAWEDEDHVMKNRELYRKKFFEVFNILRDVTTVNMPEAGFYFWLKCPIDDAKFTKALFVQQNITVLPGSFLARNTAVGNPGKEHVRIALVAPLKECTEAAFRIREFFLENFHA